MFVFLICYGSGALFAAGGHYSLSAASLLLAAAYLYCRDYLESGNPLHLRALFSLFFLGGEGVSCLKLSRLQTDWSLETWACFFVATAAFWTVYELAEKGFERQERTEAAPGGCRTDTGNGKRIGSDPTDGPSADTGYAGGLYPAVLLLTAVSLAAFLLEAVVLGYVPFFVRGVPHAYSYFHISGVHYFTVSCVLVPAMTVLLFFYDGLMPAWKRLSALAACGLSLLIPVLCVSRFQLIFAVFLGVVTFMVSSGKQKIRYLVGAAVLLIPVYVVLTIARSHDVAYLNEIFEMKNENTPIFITQPYMYIANNYDNFNCLVEQLPEHSFGLKGLFPLWALTGLKFLKPALVDFPIYTTKEELTTVTLFYDSYYDFGIAGVFFFSCLLAVFAVWLTRRLRRSRNPAWILFYAQAAIYFMLSFFTTWYSNPTTWFYLAGTAAFGIFLELVKRYGSRRRQAA